MLVGAGPVGEAVLPDTFGPDPVLPPPSDALLVLPGGCVPLSVAPPVGPLPTEPGGRALGSAPPPVEPVGWLPDACGLDPVLPPPSGAPLVLPGGCVPLSVAPPMGLLGELGGRVPGSAPPFGEPVGWLPVLSAVVPPAELPLAVPDD
ncbi:hypothetical protein [Nocardia mexicana]|uniref:Uncharacterized protein n=1 Tax=Nocardia mexicana TaxID=279262 RepID=A0A370H7K7_9NOCA|nr:hypothetical protein [Nocardia mexicana]RDI51709.1 hypothetical protein DFR68_104193 [Nocardia mexicana]